VDDARDAWKDVATKVESLGLKLKLHLEQEQDAEVQDRVEGETKNAFDELSGTVTDAFDAFGNAAKDDAVHSDVQDIAELIKQALIETFQAVGAEVGDLIEKIEDYAEDAAERINDALDGDDSGDAATDAADSSDASAEDSPIELESDSQDTV